MGLSNIALKLGSQGAMLLWDDEIFACPPQRVQPIDTTGAGDCFNAGFLYGMLQEKSPEQCLQIGNLCGALSTLGTGGLASFPERDKVLSVLQIQ
jgi:sugar/nucleoside kinase (ribokinase family)